MGLFYTKIHMIAAFSINCVHKVKIKIPLNMKRVNRGPRSKSSLVKLGGYISIKFKRFRGLYQVVCTGYQGGFGLVFGCYQVNVAFCTPGPLSYPNRNPNPSNRLNPNPNYSQHSTESYVKWNCRFFSFLFVLHEYFFFLLLRIFIKL